jgi:2-polyprenyl-3-methyl-5-hydroxy-6-metoxy-1,4-benzoquinol methylase
MKNNDTKVYAAFAEIYDRVMRDVDYRNWVNYILGLADKHKIQVQKIIELACGTGSMAIHMASIGYDIVGIDRSDIMLKNAKDKAQKESMSIPFHRADMQSFSFLQIDKDFDLVTCLYDSLNYLLEEEGIRQCFREVNQHLRPGGGFIFDVTTEYNLLQNFAGYTFAENFDNSSYIWENEYDIIKKICASKVTVFSKSGVRFEKQVEVHKQRVYSSTFLTETLAQEGFQVLATYHDLTEKPVKEKCERIHFIAQKQ